MRSDAESNSVSEGPKIANGMAIKNNNRNDSKAQPKIIRMILKKFFIKGSTVKIWRGKKEKVQSDK